MVRQILKRRLQALASQSGTLQIKLNYFILQYINTPHVRMVESSASLFLKCHTRAKIYLILPRDTNIFHDKQGISMLK